MQELPHAPMPPQKAPRVADTSFMGTIRLNHSEKFQSVYANGPSGDRLGRLDLTNGRVYIEAPSQANAIATEFVAWAARNPDMFQGARARQAIHVDEPWEDLSLREPGESLRARVHEEREKLRRRSRAMYYADKWILGDDGWAGPWLKGIAGERRIARVLNRLARRTDWRVLHSIELPGGGDIDHLLIGPDGVVTINSKNHRGAQIAVTPRAVYIRGNRTEYLDDARKDARRASEVLTSAVGFPVEVTPCVAIVSGSLFTMRFESHGLPDDVLVASEWNLPRVLWETDKGLPAETVEAIYDVARRSTTWR